MINSSAQPGQCEDVKKLLSNFLSNTDANEIADKLQLMLDCYITNTDNDRISIANAANMVNKLSQLFFNLEKSQTTKGDVPQKGVGIPLPIEN